MKLAKLHIQNFRKIDSLEISFNKGLTVILGENNVGKSAVIDALRFIIFASRDYHALRISEDDFQYGKDYPSIEISCLFSDLSEEDEANFHECLILKDDGSFDAKVSSRISWNEKTRRAKVNSWGGETEGGNIPQEIYDRLNSIYLQPLRDPESGLKPGRYSQISRLLETIVQENEKVDFENISEEANNKICALAAVKKATQELDEKLSSITGDEMAQESSLLLSHPDFRKVISGLYPEIDGKPFSLNGLGYNNLLFTAATLGTLKNSPDFSLNTMLIEEPEAHLHPQLQVLLLKHFTQATKNDSEKLQVIVTTHSPSFASQAPIESLVSLHQTDEGIASFSLNEVEFDKPNQKLKLQRYMDSTRSELFFAKKVLFVEGIAEAILLPILAEKCGGCLKSSAVTIVNVQGLNFDVFLPLYGENKIKHKAAILSDGDEKEGKISDTAQKLLNASSPLLNLETLLSEITFEYELALQPKLLKLMVKAFTEIMPIVGAKLEKRIELLTETEAKAGLFLSEFLRTKVSKGEFAQQLANKLESPFSRITEGDVPNYITNAFKYLGVISD